MSLHDAYARMTPFEIAFPDEEELERLRGAVVEEASARGIDPSPLGSFLTLASVGEFVGRLRPDEDPSGPALHQYGALVYHAVHFRHAGRPVYLVETDVARELVEEAPRAEPRPPAPAGYLQLPQHLFWMDGWEDGAPESVDGVFWSVSDDEVLHTLPITGVLPERPGFRALPLPEAPLADAPGWLEATMREGGEDFASSLPGHELDRLYAVETAGEVLKLLARFFAFVEAGAGEAEPGEGDADGPPRPSRLPFTRIRKVA